METRTLGDYKIIKTIGQGSLGTVYLAEHRFMQQQFALKVLPEDLGSDRPFVQRFEEEVKRLAALGHPHIVKIHNVSYAHGVYFLVTDCIVDEMGESTNMAQFMAANPELKEDEIVTMLRQVAEALDYAHKNGIVHRGLKLNNVLVGKGNHLYLSDYGLSKIVGVGAVLTRSYLALAEALKATDQSTTPYIPANLEMSKQVLLHNSFLQNYVFLAPEQKRQGEVTRAADVYAFGVLAYYLLMRDFPEGVFKMPSGYRNNWTRLIMQCMQTDPAKRPTSLTEALKETAETTVVVADLPLEDAPPSAPAEPITPYTPSFKMVDPGNAVVQATPDLKAPAAPESTKTDPHTSEVKRATKVGDLLTRSEPTVTTYQVTPQERRVIEPLLNEMVTIEAGTYMRGSNEGNRDEMPRHKIHLPAFTIDVHPVTNEQFLRFLEYMEGEKDSQNHDLIILRESRVNRRSGRIQIESGYSKHPVVGVTWYGAVAYTKWVGKRLPTEAEWEVAAHGGVEAIYPTGDKIERSQANFFSSDTTAVMSYQPSPFGLYDMAGNVYEWCQDWYGYNFYENSSQEPDSPSGPLQGVYRVLRGGCWKSLAEDMRCSHRHRNNPGTVNGTYGFRCASDA